MALDFLKNTQILTYDQMENQSSPNVQKVEEPAEPEEKGPEYSGTGEEGRTDFSGLKRFDELDFTSNTEDKTEIEDKTDTKVEKAAEAKATKKYLAFIKAFKDKRPDLFLDVNEEDFEDSPESFINYFEDSLYSTAQNLVDEHIKTNLSPLQQRFVNMVDAGADESQALNLFKEIKKLEEVSEDKIQEDPKIAKAIYEQYLKKTTRFSDSKIAKEIEELSELGNLSDKALEALPELKTITKQEEIQMLNEAKRREDEQNQNALAQAKMLSDYLETTEEIAGIKLTKKMKDDWKKEYSNVETESGPINPIIKTRDLDPTKFDALLRLYHSMGLFKWDGRKKDFSPDFNLLSKINKNTVYKEIEDAIDLETAKQKHSGGKGISDIETDPNKQEHLQRLIELGKSL